MKRSDVQELISFLLILMLSYAAISKLIDIRSFRIQMLMQPVPKWSVNYLIVFIPLSEITTVILLLFQSTKSFGLYAAASLMLFFTLYVGLAMAGIFGSVPCSCGGVIGKLNWPQHFVFNLFFLSLSIYGLIVDHKKRRFIGR